MTHDPGQGGQPGGQPHQQPFAAGYPPAPPAPPPVAGYVVPAGPYPMYLGTALAGPVDPGPRPVLVTAAVGLTFAGIGVAFLAVLLAYLANMDVATSADPRNTPALSNAVGAFVSAGFNLVAGAGAAVCAVFTMRGSNGARITLCVLCGAFAGWKLMCGGVNLVALSFLEGRTPLGYRIGFGYAATALDLVLMVLAIGILVLLLVGPSHRYFTRPKPTRYG